MIILLLGTQTSLKSATHISALNRAIPRFTHAIVLFMDSTSPNSTLHKKGLLRESRSCASIGLEMIGPRRLRYLVSCTVFTGQE